jgi:hypothetical protein
MIERLEAESDPETVITLLSGLQRLGVEWPPAMRAKWMGPGSPLRVRQAIELMERTP